MRVYLCVCVSVFYKVQHYLTLTLLTFFFFFFGTNPPFYSPLLGMCIRFTILISPTSWCFFPSFRAWKNFIYSYGFLRRSCIRRKDYVIEVPDNYFVFEQIEQSIDPRKHRANIATEPSSGDNIASSSQKVAPSKDKDLLKGKVPNQRTTK